jgi:hypothetical protein
VSATPQVVERLSLHRSSRGGAPVVAIVIHATAGTNSLSWLLQNPSQVSAHALITKEGLIYRLVPDEQAAHHCGFSRLVHRGRVIDKGTVPGPNQVTLGVEIENRNTGSDPYPAAQLSALGWLLVQWARKFPAARLVFHREIDTQGKSDPAGLDWPAVYAAMAPWLAPAPPRFTFSADSLLVAPSPLPPDALARALVRRCAGGHYSPDTVAALASLYAGLERAVGVNAWLAAAQMCHETGNLTSERSRPPQHNLAGIGATNDGARGVEFPGLEAACRAQVGRLLAYALPPGDRFGSQVALVDEALRWRPLPLHLHGSAPRLRALGAAHNPHGTGWAMPGDRYGEAVANVANALMELGR